MSTLLDRLIEDRKAGARMNVLEGFIADVAIKWPELMYGLPTDDRRVRCSEDLLLHIIKKSGFKVDGDRHLGGTRLWGGVSREALTRFNNTAINELRKHLEGYGMPKDAIVMTDESGKPSDDVMVVMEEGAAPDDLIEIQEDADGNVVSTKRVPKAKSEKDELAEIDRMVEEEVAMSDKYEGWGRW